MPKPSTAPLPYVQATTHNGHRTYVPIWLPPHPSGKRGAYVVPTRGATHCRRSVRRLP